MNENVMGFVRVILFSLVSAVIIGAMMAYLVQGELVGMWVLIPAAVLGGFWVARWVRDEYTVRWKNRKLFRELRSELEREER